ncbi:DNA-processing protein DprA [Paracoccus albus]|uniref:DNA-processing protein DprA n=1 Tax=Paracoccus albus TaxID=3017784 RepID=UPI0022F0D3AB|nr:DNA-processing protein DprA [Paracoccus albus]WBU60678.1 DNA-processing protein DprA [Paracoccus albus]
MFSFTSPRTPPTAKDDDLSFLRLIRSRRVGPTTFHRLVAEHGSAAAALDALPDIARGAGVKEYSPCTEAAALAELKAGRKGNAILIRCDSPEYPAALREIPDAPPVLWVKGNAAALSHPTIAVIGARNASSLGLRMARGMASALAEAGNTVIAGLARGIDTAAHEASVKHGTVAVIAGGIDQIYPVENKVLAATICDRGCLISEQPPGVAPVARHFPLRNRIISGLAQGVVIIEAAVKSGSLITARNALDQGREVLAVPGHPVDGRAGGCNQLIRDGAILVRNADDVLEAIPALSTERQAGAAQLSSTAATTPLPAQRQRETSAMAAIAPRSPALPLPPRKAQNAATLESQVLAHLSPNPIEEDSLIRDLGVPASILSPVLVQLELAGKLTRMAGGRISLQ